MNEDASRFQVIMSVNNTIPEVRTELIGFLSSYSEWIVILPVAGSEER